MKNNILYIVLLITTVTFAQQSQLFVLDWKVNPEYLIGSNTIKIPQFQTKNMDYLTAENLLLAKIRIPLENYVPKSSLQVISVSYSEISESALFDLDKSKIPTSIQPDFDSFNARSSYFGILTFAPIIKDAAGFKKVTDISYQIITASGNRTASINQVAGISNSVLATGNWYKFYIEKSGVYKISKSFLQSLGLNTNVDPRTIKIYGNGGRMLPLLNDTPYPEDLEENAIQFIGEADGNFDSSDYILFYAEGTDKWNAESGTSVNLFADKTYYYVTASVGEGKRIANAPEIATTANLVFNKYDTTLYYEKDLVNVAKIGRRWFGEQFIIKDKQNFDFTVPNLVSSIPIKFRINAAAVAFTATSFGVKINNQDVGSIPLNGLNPTGGSNIGYETELAGNFTATSPIISVELTYNNNGLPSANGYLDFIELKAKCNLAGYGKQFHFCNEQTETNVGVGQFDFSNASTITEVWNITDIYNVTTHKNTSAASFSFKFNLGTPSKFIAIDGNDFLLPGKDRNASVANQNIKGTIFKDNSGNFEDVDYLIFAPNFLVSQAETLANFHRTHSGLKVRVLALENVYEEFSSGKQDVAAIRNAIKYVYWNASSPEKRVKYVNLFGDASYDYKNRIPNNNNIVPIFHGFFPNTGTLNNASNMSLYTSFMSDDFFGLMDLGEGPMTSSTDAIDIAVGRMLVSTTTEAQDMVNKILEYHDEKSFGRWRNNYVILSDDADTVVDSSLQFGLDNLANVLTAQKPFVNVKTIHSDAYIQQVAAGGERYPEAKKDLLDAFALGGLVFNYFGHGSEEVLSKERLFEKVEAQNLTNRYRYPLFITITCEFTRFDDPNRRTGGEYMFWNKAGGAIALIATTRQIGVDTGYEMNNEFSENLYAFGSNNYPTIAEALRKTKLTTVSSNRRVVFYIGDPALQLAIPKPKIVLTKINDTPVNQPLPVLQALSQVKIAGEVRDENDVLLSNYNGDLAVQIFDKEINRNTLGNNGITNSNGLIIMNFKTLGETVFRGNASVVNGKFEFNFIMPQDIRIPVGNGKISFYAKRDTPNLDNHTGYDKNIKIGGVNTNAPIDTTPPTANLFMNDESFVSGGITNCAPILYAKLFDANGINTASGIGHDIVAILDGNETNPYILNDYYETENDDFTKGFVRFPFTNLEPGMHTVVFKAWDVYNNLITSEIQFNAICSNEGLVLERVLNYPNPFVNYTEFWFHHNMPFETLEVQVQILTVSGKIVKTIQQNVVTDGFLCREIKWDGKDDFGDKIGKGTYVYQLKVKSITTGKTVEKFEKLVIL